MKGFKKLALVAAIAAPMTSVHALEALDDSTLSGMTGQAGVTIDLSTRVEIGSVAWTDTAEGTPGEVGGGTVSFDTVTVGGIAPGSALDDVRLLIDAADSGDLEILVVSQSGGAVDLGVDVAGISLNNSAGDTSSTIASNINLDILLAPQKFVVNNDGANGSISAKGFFQLADTSSLDLDVAGVSITGLRVGNFLGANAATGIAGVDAFTGTDYTAGLGFAYYDATIQANGSNQLQIDVNNFNADIQMNVGIGGASIGQITMTDFDVSGTQLTVYGH